MKNNRGEPRHVSRTFDARQDQARERVHSRVKGEHQQRENCSEVTRNGRSAGFSHHDSTSQPKTINARMTSTKTPTRKSRTTKSYALLWPFGNPRASRTGPAAVSLSRDRVGCSSHTRARTQTAIVLNDERTSPHMPSIASSFANLFFGPCRTCSGRWPAARSSQSFQRAT